MPRTQSARRWPDLVWSGDVARAVLSRALDSGQLQRIGRGIYAPAAADAKATVARNWSRILARELPGAVLVDRSARALRPIDGRLFVDHPRRHPLELPGLSIEPRAGPGRLPSDYLGPDGNFMSSPARGLLDNLAQPNDRLLSRGEVEQWVDQLIALYGETRINEIRDQARALAGPIRRREAFKRLNTIIRAALSTGPVRGLASRELAARAAGKPIDGLRVARFEALAAHLADLAPEFLTVLPQFAGRRALLPFYETYFSNYIEGTVFTLDEAAEIVFEQHMPTQRPADAHDILGTFRLVSEPDWQARTAADATGFAALLQARHALLMDARPEVGPGRFREANVRAGGTTFVRWQQVEGTLGAGIEAGAGLIDPFARAVFVHFLVSEVHPFADGNGRISRMTMNAELSTAAESRIVVPTGFRDEYISSLRAASNNDRFDATVRVLAFARRWTARMDFSSRDVAEPLLEQTNALVEPSDAISSGLKLLLP